MDAAGELGRRGSVPGRQRLRSFAASEFEGDDADCIYFTDDGYYPVVEEERITAAKFWSVDWLNQQLCRDIGRFSMRTQSVTFLRDLPWNWNERRSPPTWLYLSDRRR